MLCSIQLEGEGTRFLGPDNPSSSGVTNALGQLKSQVFRMRAERHPGVVFPGSEFLLIALSLLPWVGSYIMKLRCAEQEETEVKH